MYYEEKMIGGKLKCRTTPNGEWEECSIEKCWDLIVELQDQAREMKNAMRIAGGILDEYS